MISTLVVNCTPIHHISKDDEKTPAERASDEMVVGAVQALCELSLLVSQQNHSDLSLPAGVDAQRQCQMKKEAIRAQKLSRSAQANVDEQLATESHQLWVQMIYKISAAVEVQVYGAETITTTNWRQFQVHLNRAQQVATEWSDADWQRAKSNWSAKSIRWHLLNTSFVVL